jgi:hypothetical protein
VKKSASQFPAEKISQFEARSNMSDCSASLSYFPRAEKSDFQFFHTFLSPYFHISTVVARPGNGVRLRRRRKDSNSGPENE